MERPGGLGYITRAAVRDMEDKAISENNTNDIKIVERGGRRFVLVGTAHVSKESAELVRKTIETEKPDRVCVELDSQRYEALSKKDQWDKLDIKQVIKRKQLATLMVNLLLASFQKKIGGKLGIMPGTELLEATRAAEENGIPFSLCDRNIRITLLRAWRSMSFFQRFKLLAGLLESVFGDTEISEEELQELRQKDVLSELMQELARVMPSLKKVLIDERDVYLAEKIRESEGDTVVAVVGAGHVAGISEILAGSDDQTDLEPIEQIPEAFPLWKWVGYGIPVIIIGSLGLIAWTKGGEVAGQNLMFWVLINGIPCGIGAILALAHPLTILVAFISAPITSLTPVVGAGYVTAFVQAYFHPPLVKDFHALWDDIAVFRGWWRNRLLKVFLALIFPSIGSVIGTYVGLGEILSNLF